MRAIDYIKAEQAAGPVDKKGKPIAIEYVPGLTAESIESVEQRVGLPLPEELRTLLTYCAGIREAEIDFTGEAMHSDYTWDEVFPNGLPIARDGSGNFWVLDITPDTTAAAPIFFACHDAPVVLYQSPDIAGFLREMLGKGGSLTRDVHEDRLFDVWRKNPGVIDHATALQSSDAAIRAFALQLPNHFQIVDLRNVRPGMGFSWGRYGPKTEVRRHGHERMFAYAKPPGRGFFGKLFGR